ncbi:ABC-2 type transporter [Nitzschia inconspicua]|uniref:ABC-2 type transporter n=1 Tax=Nitzschia inconspicua TaxID=303405 RepID=A0A9K3Q244_9STRA|nr:ABC-2 type transporter [Nitzschia inconspicua]
MLPEPYTTDGVEGKDELGITLTEHHLAEDFDDSTPGIFTQLSMLSNREIKNIRRDTAAVGGRFGLTIFLSLLVGLIFKDVGGQPRDTVSNLNSQFGALIMVLLMILHLLSFWDVLLKTLSLDRKCSPFVCSSNAICCFFVAPKLIPVWLRWAQYLCTLTYAVRIALVEEFGDGCPAFYPNGTVIEDEAGQVVDPCYNLLDNVVPTLMTHGGTGLYWLHYLQHSVLLHFLCYSERLLNSFKCGKSVTNEYHVFLMIIFSNCF